MRWSGFLVGGLVGMAAAVYMAKKRPGMFAWASSAAGDAWSNMRGKAVNSIINRKFGSDTRPAAQTAANQSGVSVDKSGEAWGQIEKMLNSDPAVKKQANEVMAEAGTH